MCLYFYNNQTTAEFIADMKWAELYTSVFASAKDDFWFGYDDLKCNSACCSGCPDKKTKFIYSAGFRVDKKNKIGHGGFGAVYVGNVHNTEVAAKFVDVTAKYRALIVGSRAQPFIMHQELLSDLAYEASAQSSFAHKHILLATEWWFQFSKGNLIELVIATPKCHRNLQKWGEMEPFNFDQNRRFLVETSEALRYLAKKNLTHRDVKPANILITEQQNPVAKLTGFGLMKHDGVTPGFCAPEQLVTDGTVIGKTDVYGFGITTMVTLFEENDAINILFGVTKSIPHAEIENAQSDPVLTLVASMIQFDPSARPSLPAVAGLLRNLPPIIVRKTISKMSNTLSNTIQSSFKGLQFFNLSIMPSVQLHSSIISGSINDQKQSVFSWSFSLGSIIIEELKRLISKLAHAKWITGDIAAKALSVPDTLKLQNSLMNELVCLVLSRNSKRDNLNSGTQFSGQDCFEKICSKALLRPAGWTRLPSVRRITDHLTKKSKSI